MQKIIRLRRTRNKKAGETKLGIDAKGLSEPL